MDISKVIMDNLEYMDLYDFAPEEDIEAARKNAAILRAGLTEIEKEEFGFNKEDKIMNAFYISIWDDEDEVRTSCQYNPENNTVTNIVQVEEPAGANSCTREYIELPDGSIIDDFTIEE